MNKKVLVVDLDGTLYKINTFHHFLRFIVISCVKNLRLVPLIEIIGFMGLRFLKISSHAKLKYNVLKVISDKNWINQSKFVKSISEYKRNLNVEKSEFDITILATAAPSSYAEIIAKNENFGLCMATNYLGSAFHAEFENSKEVKKDTVMNYLNKSDIDKIGTLITDHIDDLPLMKVSENVKIVQPNENLIADLKRQEITFEIINC